MAASAETTRSDPPAPCISPDSVIKSTAIARTLTISDQHATILLTSSPSAAPVSGVDDEKSSPAPTVTRSLLKLTLVPFHKNILASLPMDESTKAKLITTSDDSEQTEAEKEHSSAIMNFLSHFDWRMTSESGAEYSYHEAFLKKFDDVNTSSSEEEEGGESESKRLKMDTSDEEGKGVTPTHGAGERQWKSFNVELISPASERQLARAMPSPGLSMIVETPTLYESKTKPFVDEIRASGSLSWLENVVTGKKEKERLLHNAEDWILNVDTKWRTHPDALTVPRSEWLNHESVIDLYCLGIIKTKNISSLRDLTADHLPTLREMLESGPTVIESVYGVPRDQLRIFVHYPPQFYHFHVHFTRLENDTGAQVEKAHLLQDVIQNLESNSNFYQTRTIEYKLSKKEKLYKLQTAGADESG